MGKQSLTIKFEEYDSVADLPEDERALVNAAWIAREKAYAPYSHFFVGAAVQTKEGKVFCGSNQETANYTGSHAERVALDSASMAGLRRAIKKIAIVGGPETLNPTEAAQEAEKPVSPCGGCRQDIKEHEDLSGEPITIILASRDKVIRTVGIANLLPFAFGPADLKI